MPNAYKILNEIYQKLPKFYDGYKDRALEKTLDLININNNTTLKRWSAILFLACIREEMQKDKITVPLKKLFNDAHINKYKTSHGDKKYNCFRIYKYLKKKK